MRESSNSRTDKALLAVGFFSSDSLFRNPGHVSLGGLWLTFNRIRFKDDAVTNCGRKKREHATSLHHGLSSLDSTCRLTNDSGYRQVRLKFLLIPFAGTSISRFMQRPVLIN